VKFVSSVELKLSIMDEIIPLVVAAYANVWQKQKEKRNELVKT